MPKEWDCAVVGGGAAGLSAALVLGRARRRSVVIDADQQSNRASLVIGGLLGHDRRPPAELYAAGRRELVDVEPDDHVQPETERLYRELVPPKARAG